MARTDATAIGKIFDIDTDVITDTTPFIGFANRLVTKFCSLDDYSETELTEIETWLAAHACSVKQKIARKEDVDILSESFEGVTKMHLQSSLYGQQAMMLDWAGGLSAWNDSCIKGRKRKHRFQYLGKTKDVSLGIDDGLD